MNAAERKDYQIELYEIARNTRDALFSEWETSAPGNKFFKDKHSANQMTERGLLPEGIGTTSVLLLLAAFGKSIFSYDDIEKCNEIVNTALSNLREWSKEGYLATPVLSAEDGQKAFNENAGYVDTVTWCLSSAILARYNEKRGLLHLEDDVRDYVFDAIGKGILTLCDSQKDGRWGFRTDTDSDRSLYFSYSASASIADFFDYILGEVALLDLPAGATEDEKDKAIEAACDREVIDYINKTYGCDISAKVTETRKALCEWIIHDALPLLPQIASCDPLDKSTLKMLGMWEHEKFKSDEDETSKIFYHLYYTYYLLDMMVTSGTDTRFLEIIENPEELKALAKYYKDNNRLNKTDILYYFYDLSFEEADIKRGMYHYDEFFSKTVECALYTARSQYSTAAKTGAKFWDIAELKLQFNHREDTVTSEVKNLPFKDPSVIAMALRANITYSYYVTETQDIAIERLFDEMCADIYSEQYRESLSNSTRMNKDKKCVVNLWDRTNYSLPLTERAVEALVDFKDYLDKFYSKTASAVEHSETAHTETKIEYVQEPSAIDKAIEAKIAEYLQSDAGRKLIEDACDARLASTSSNSTSDNGDILSDEKVIDWLNNRAQDIDASLSDDLLKKTDLDAWINFFEALQKCSLIKNILDKEQKQNLAKCEKNAAKFEDQKKQLLKEIFKDIEYCNTNPNDGKKYELPALYKQLKEARKND